MAAAFFKARIILSACSLISDRNAPGPKQKWRGNGPVSTRIEAGTRGSPLLAGVPDWIVRHRPDAECTHYSIEEAFAIGSVNRLAPMVMKVCISESYK